MLIRRLSFLQVDVVRCAIFAMAKGLLSWAWLKKPYYIQVGGISVIWFWIFTEAQ